MSIEEIKFQALRLAPSERARLARRLIASLDEEASLDEGGEVEDAWTKEATRRWEGLASGEVAALPVADVLAEARRAVS